MACKFMIENEGGMRGCRLKEMYADIKKLLAGEEAENIQGIYPPCFNDALALHHFENRRPTIDEAMGCWRYQPEEIALFRTLRLQHETS